MRAARVGEIAARTLANIAYGAARSGSGRSLGILFVALARAGSVGDFKAQELANTAWAFATVGRSDELLFVVLARDVERRMDEFNE